MKRTLFLFAAVLLTLSALAETRQRYTISTNGPSRTATLRVAVTSDGAVARRIRTFDHINGFAADLTAEEAEELRRTAGVVSVDPVVPRYASTIDDLGAPANLETYAQQVTPWGVPVIRAREVWGVTHGQNVNVAVIDTGIDFNHPELKGVYAGGYNVLKPAALPLDDHLHGTHVAGTIAAADNAFGVVGAAPGVRLWAVKALDFEGKGDSEYTAAAIDWVVGKQREIGGRWVVNMSLGAALKGGQLEQDAMARAINAGIVLVAAAGNRSTAFLDYPAAYPNVIAVGAVGQDGKRAEFSSYGQTMEVVAPGVRVPSTILDGKVEASDLVVGSTVYETLPVSGSPKGTLTGKLVYCGIGRPEEIPASVKGNIALISRGTLEFREKSRNAKEAGAIAVIIHDNVEDTRLRPWTMTPNGCTTNCGEGWNGYKFPVTLAVSLKDGMKLRELANSNATVSYEFARYLHMSGTSMATPHVVGVVAIMLSLDPTLRPTEVLHILKHTARDTAEPGWDPETGWGIVDALGAAQYVAPDRFGVPPPPAPKGKRRGSRS